MSESTEAKRVYRRLQEGDFKLTRQRRIIVGTLLKCEDQHPSAEDLHQLVREQLPDVGLATIYRTLDLLERLGIIRGVNFGDGRTRYELTSELHQHHHLVCVRCGAIEEVDEDLLGDVEDEISRRTGFTIVDHDLKIYGICHECREIIEDEESSSGKE
ncbi:MAG: Fur family transcriptional regulator [Clostridia bacterium]